MEASRNKVKVYRNLRRNAWSVKVEGRPVEHWHSLLLTDVSFVVWPGGRARVHAFAVGVIQAGLRLDPQGNTRRVGHPQTLFGMAPRGKTSRCSARGPIQTPIKLWSNEKAEIPGNADDTQKLFGMGHQRDTFPVGYNPFLAPHFVRKDTNERIEHVDRLFFPHDGPPKGWDLADQRRWIQPQKGLER